MEKSDHPGPDWGAFGRALAVAELRILGLAPVPPELQEQVDKIRRERMAEQKSAAS